MGVALVRTPATERVQVKPENGRWSKGLRLPEGLHRIDNFLAGVPEDTRGRLGTQPLGGKVSWGKPVLIPTLEDRVRLKLPNAPLGMTFFVDRKAGSSSGPDVLLARQSTDPGKLPPLKPWSSFSGNAARCAYAKHGRHFITISINGSSAKGQPRAVYEFRDVAYELLQDYDVEIVPISSQRSCGYQCDVCRNICGNCGGCPGRCAEPGSSCHQPGCAFDFAIKRHPKRSYAQAYQLVRKVATKHDFKNFTGWNPGGTDPNHMCLKDSV